MDPRTTASCRATGGSRALWVWWRSWLVVVRFASFASFASLVACGGATVRGDELAPARVVPPGPVPSAMHATPDFSMRIDVAALRASPLAPDLSSAYAGGGLYARVLSAAGVDPVQALDAVAVTAVGVSFAPGRVVSPRWRIAMRHRLGAEGARDAIGRAGVGLGVPIAWRESQGIPSARLPTESVSSPPRAIVLSGPAEAFVAPDDEISDVVGVVRDHLARRTLDETIEPALIMPEGLVAEAAARTVPDALLALGIVALEVRLHPAEGGLRIEGLASTAPYADVAALAATGRSEAARLGQNALVRAMGVTGVLSRLVLAEETGGVRFETTASWAELRTLLGLLVAAAH